MNSLVHRCETLTRKEGGQRPAHSHGLNRLVSRCNQPWGAAAGKAQEAPCAGILARNCAMAFSAFRCLSACASGRCRAQKYSSPWGCESISAVAGSWSANVSQSPFRSAGSSMAYMPHTLQQAGFIQRSSAMTPNNGMNRRGASCSTVLAYRLWITAAS